jgi:hypothetical protein
MRPQPIDRRPKSASGFARLAEARAILARLRSRGIADADIAQWLSADLLAIARWRAGTAAPSAGALASLRRYVRVARHGH